MKRLRVTLWFTYSDLQGRFQGTDISLAITVSDPDNPEDRETYMRSSGFRARSLTTGEDYPTPILHINAMRKAVQYVKDMNALGHNWVDHWRSVPGRVVEILQYTVEF